jgi:hypothetical protein
MINFFIETKNEYTIQLVNLLTPIIYEGLQSIYSEAMKTAEGTPNLLKIFQTFLKKIPTWNNDMILNETQRITSSSKSSSWLPELVKATIKANILVLIYNPYTQTHGKIDSDYYKHIKLEDFIHKVYIESARELWNNPYLMYHIYTPIELKRNQRDTILLIKDAIKEAIRKLLPVKQILEIYLGEELEKDIPSNEQFDKNISEVDERNIQKLINNDLINEHFTKSSSENNRKKHQIGGAVRHIHSDTNHSKDLNTKILDIINEKSGISVNNTSVQQKYLSENNIKNSKTRSSSPTSSATSSMSNSSSSSKNKYVKSKVDIKHNKSISSTSEIKKDNTNATIDSKIKYILEKDLGETDIETSLSHQNGTTDKKYQEIFTNNSIKIDKNQSNKDNLNPINENETYRNKKKFLTKYLNI